MSARRVYDDAQFHVNLRAAYDAAQCENPALFNQGTKWYTLVREQLTALASQYHTTLPVVAGVAAALSADVGWGRNLLGTQLALQSWKSGAQSWKDLPGVCNTYSINRRKAWAILQGADPDTVLANFGKGSRNYKTRRFMVNLCGHEYVATIDRHMRRIAYGIPKVDAGQKNDRVPNGGEYLAIESALIDVAREVGLTPAQLQAGLWCVYIGGMG